MSVNILFEQLRKPNAYPASSDFYFENYYCPRHRTILPLEFHQMEDLKIVSLDDLKYRLLCIPYHCKRTFLRH